MDDIVDRLRYISAAVPAKLMAEAADEIARLRTAPTNPPDLLEALTDMIAGAQHIGYGDHPVVKKAKAIAAKATQRS